MEQQVFGSLTGPFRFRRFLNRFRSAALDIIDKEKIQLVAGHWLVPSGMVMKQIACESSLPMILSSHGTDIRLMKKHRRIVYPYFKRFCRSLRKWTVVSNFLKEEIIRLDSSLTDILEVLPLPHNEAIFYKDESIQRESDLVVSVTRFTSQKRVNYLIKAFATVVEKHPHAILEIYGSGPMQTDIERLIKDLDLQQQVRLFPPVRQKELREVYNRAAIVVLNSFEEGFGLTLSEAMLCGAAVVGTDSGGIPDIIEHQKRGLLVPLDDSPALAGAILELLNNSPLRRTLADNGYRFARESYASRPLATRYARLVQEALE
jgi:glycosyltransferase involved in cell wall biosynthesis